MLCCVVLYRGWSCGLAFVLWVMLLIFVLNEVGSGVRNVLWLCCLCCVLRGKDRRLRVMGNDILWVNVILYCFVLQYAMDLFGKSVLCFTYTSAALLHSESKLEGSVAALRCDLGVFRVLHCVVGIVFL